MTKQELIEELNKTNSICGIEINAQQKQALRYVAIRMEQLDEIDYKQKDARIAELEKQLADKKETATYKNNFCVNCCKDKSGEQIICLKCHEEVCNAYKKQLAELEELKQNAIVPKFNFGDTIFAVVTYIDDPKDKTVIESGIVQKIECDKNQIKYWCDNGRIYWEDECEKLFTTEQEAQQKLKELEETK